MYVSMYKHAVKKSVCFFGEQVKGYFQDQKGPIWTFVIYLGQYLKNGCMKHIIMIFHMVFQLAL